MHLSGWIQVIWIFPFSAVIYLAIQVSNQDPGGNTFRCDVILFFSTEFGKYMPFFSSYVEVVCKLLRINGY